METVEEIDQQINAIRHRIRQTEDQMIDMIALNDGRRKRLRELGRIRSELLTQEFAFDPPAEPELVVKVHVGAEKSVTESSQS